MDYNEFAEKIKTKYPEYNDMDNYELAQKMVAKYPKEYADVTFDNANTDYDYKVDKKGNVTLSTGIDFTPSGVIKSAANNVSSAVLSPFTLRNQDGMNLSERFNDNKKYIQEHSKEIDNPVLDTATDIVAYSALPEIKAAQGAGALSKVGKFLANSAVQGGIPFALESLKEGNNPLVGAGYGTGIAGAINAALPPLAKGTGAIVSKTINNDVFKNGLAKTLEFLTSVPAKYTKLALDAELAGKSILEGKFNTDTAYRGVEQKLTAAKNSLPDKTYFDNQYKQLGEQLNQKLNNAVKPQGYYDEQYRQISDVVNDKIQQQIKPATYFANKYYNAGQKAVNGLNTLKENAGSAINEALAKLNDEALANNYVNNAVDSVINSFGEGGVYNSAREEAGRLVDSLTEKLNKEGLTLRDLHRIKEWLYKQGYKADAINEGTTATVARGTAEQINNYLRRVAPDYAQPNDVYSSIVGLEHELGGLNPNTVAGKLHGYGSPTNIENGFDRKIGKLNDMLPAEQKFLNDVDAIQSEQYLQDFLNRNVKEGTNIAKFDTLPTREQALLEYYAPNEIQRFKDLSLQQGLENELSGNVPQAIRNNISKYDNAPIHVQDAVDNLAPQEMQAYQALKNEQNAINDINTAINKYYTRNPKLLANRTDEGFENALNELQDRANINFMDELNQIRARDALEKLMPGQGGGSGSEQGIMNNFVRPTLNAGGRVVGATVLGNTFGGPIGAGLGLLSVSPKLTAKGSIKNLGKLNNWGQNTDGSVLSDLLRLFAIKNSKLQPKDNNK